MLCNRCSAAATLGGMTTAIGTSTNLVASGLMQSHGMDPMRMFEITALGGAVAVGGVVYLIVAAPRLLPERGSPRASLESSAREFVVEMKVVPAGPLDGVEVEAGGLRSLEGVFLTEVRREGETIAPARPDTRLHGGDVLVFVGQADLVLDLRNKPGLRSAEHEHAQAFHAAGHTSFEAVVGPASPLVGVTLREAEFRGRYRDLPVARKSDDSLLTVADQRAHRVIEETLRPTGIPILSEEGASVAFEERRRWQRLWIVDPPDGTKEFLKRNGEFTVNVALVEEDYPVIGVIYAPATGALYWSSPDLGAWKATISVGSSLKICLVAEGSADFYPRFAPTMEWDTAAGRAIAEAAGKTFVEVRTGARVRYNREQLRNEWFLVR